MTQYNVRPRSDVDCKSEYFERKKKTTTTKQDNF